MGGDPRHLRLSDLRAGLPVGGRRYRAGHEGALEPIWAVKARDRERRVRGRIEAVLDWATVRQFRAGDNPARWRGHLDKLLPARAKVRAVNHHIALPYADLPGFHG